MNQLDSLRALLAVNDLGGFAAAARALDTSPAKVTRLIQDLERTLNTRLLQRTTRTLSPTEAGELYIARIRPVIDALDAANDEVSTSGRLPSGVLKVRSSLDFAAAQLIPRVSRLQRLYPKLEVEINTSDRLLESPDLESDLTMLFSRNGLADGDFVARKLGMTSGVMCASPQYLKIHPAPNHPSELVRHECLLPSGKDLPHSFLLASVDPHDPQQFEFRPGPAKFHSNSSEALYHAALQGLGLVGMLSVHAQPYIRSGALVRVLPQWIGERWQVWAGYAGRRHVPRKVQAFLEFLQTEFGDPELDPWLV